MTAAQLHIKTGAQRHWLDISGLFFFASAIILLSVLNFFHSLIEIKRPAILLTASIFALIRFKESKAFSILQKIILLYMIGMLFNQLSEGFVHIRSFSIHLSLIAMMPLAASFICFQFQKLKRSSIETNDLLTSWTVVFGIIILHMLFLFLLLKNIYGYGYERYFDVLANLCLYFLTFIFTWEQIDNIYIHRITAINFIVFFMLIMIKGY
jgi:hypothetical protein